MADDPTGGWAAATRATADASKEAIGAGRALARFISAPANEVVGILHDHLKVVRLERQIRLAERVRRFLAERGLEAPTRTIPLKIGLPLIDNATLEEDNNLQDLWAQLLANGGDAQSGVELTRAFVTVMADLSPLDALVLAKIAEHSDDLIDRMGISTVKLPLVAEPGADEDFRKPIDPAVAVSLSNLTRLGCVQPSPGFDGKMFLQIVRLTPFGRALVRAVSTSPNI